MTVYRVIIWGAGNIAREALKYVSSTVKIIGFLDNNPDIKEFEGLNALEKEKIGEYEYDYIVICSVYDKEIYRQLIGMSVEASRILMNPVLKAQSYEIYKHNFFKRKWISLLGRAEKPELFISGISYHNDGIDEQIILKKTGKRAFNFAMRGQDIFYDFQIAKLLDRNGYLEKTMHYIVGLCYYSFEYDMSKSVHGWEIIRYYSFIREQHNLASAVPFGDFTENVKSYLEECAVYYELFHTKTKHIVNDEEGRRTAEQDFNKNYPVTVWENRIILREFLNFLIDRQIKPVIVIMPAVKGYVGGVPKKFRERFYDSLAVCAGNVQILDYFGYYYGDVSDYYHVSHFNKNGAEKFTEKLIGDIYW